MPTTHVVQAGENLSAIAERHGFRNWRTIHDAAGGIYLCEPDIEAGVVRIADIRDPNSTPPRSWPRHAGDFNPGHFHVVPLPADPIPAALPIELVRSARRPLRNEDGTPARDMLFGDYTQQQIEDIGVMFQLDDAGYDLATVAPAVLLAEFRRMATELFSMGALEDSITQMIDRFEANTGAEYSNSDLTDAVRNHASTGRFEQNIRRELRRLINVHQSDVNRIELNQMNLVGRPRYNTNADILGGLTIAINDTQAHDVDLIEYELNGSRYTGKFRLTLYDHFGLDQPDVEKRYGMLSGFRAWFILQHLQRLAFRTFVTGIVLDYDFSGTVGA
jgi:hypothetical protein